MAIQNRNPELYESYLAQLEKKDFIVIDLPKVIEHEQNIMSK